MRDAILTSLQNPQVKRLAKLRQARERARTGLTRIDGARELLLALRAGLVPETLYVCPARLATAEAHHALDAALAAGTRRQAVSEEVYARIQYGDRDEGLCATVAWRPHRLDELTVSPDTLWLVLEGLEKPGNLGAILRTADAAGVGAVILAEAALDPSNPNAVRASMGTLFTVPVISCTTAQALTRLRELEVDVVTAALEAQDLYTAVDLRGPVALVLGPERDTPSPAWQRAGRRVRIPLRGAADSLNVSVAAAILMFEAVRQRAQP